MEEEVLMPPGSFLEVVGVPRVVHLENSKGSVLEIPVQISCPKTATIEQTRASRKTSLLRPWSMTCSWRCANLCLSLILVSLSPSFPHWRPTEVFRTFRSFVHSYLMFRTFVQYAIAYILILFA
jgi:hypothetical protein